MGLCIGQLWSEPSWNYELLSSLLPHLEWLWSTTSLLSTGTGLYWDVTNLLVPWSWQWAVLLQHHEYHRWSETGMWPELHVLYLVHTLALYLDQGPQQHVKRMDCLAHGHLIQPMETQTSTEALLRIMIHTHTHARTHARTHAHTHTHTHTHIYTQGVPGGMCQTLGGCSLC